MKGIWPTISICVLLKTHHLSTMAFEIWIWVLEDKGCVFLSSLSPQTSKFAARNFVAVCEYSFTREVWTLRGLREMCCAPNQLGWNLNPLPVPCSELGGDISIPSFKEGLLFFWDIPADAAVCLPLVLDEIIKTHMKISLRWMTLRFFLIKYQNLLPNYKINKQSGFRIL